jgi:hypothetical protein
MTYKIISSQGEIFDIDFEINSKSIKLDQTISGRVYLEFVNANIENILLTKEAKEVYNHLWTNEEQFESKVLRMQNNQ